jgi:endonuclease/exonuclease/phosphatase family metal-dependent hydrolase
MTVRIVSYNLLVPIYADRPEYLSKCEPKYLKTDYRWKLIQAHLEQEIVHHENTIICLQEVSLPMLPKLELLFRGLNYSFFHNLYGSCSNDYMGVGIAIPVSMQLTDIFYIKIGDHIRSISKPHEKQTNLLAWGWNLYQFALSKFIELPSDPWKKAMSRGNALICLQVVIDGKPLYIGNYHMPCLYDEPAVMAIHSSVVKDLMFQLAAGQDFILAGDFNLLPNDTAYQALIEKGYIDVHFPKSNDYDISYRPNTEQVLKSAYREKNGSEPVYTNFFHMPHWPDFCGTLDYIFFNGQLTVENVLELPDQPTGESYPDETHPSDHLMIAVTLRLP